MPKSAQHTILKKDTIRISPEHYSSDKIRKILNIHQVAGV